MGLSWYRRRLRLFLCIFTAYHVSMGYKRVIKYLPIIMTAIYNRIRTEIALTLQASANVQCE